MSAYIEAWEDVRRHTPTCTVRCIQCNHYRLIDLRTVGCWWQGTVTRIFNNSRMIFIVVCTGSHHYYYIYPT